MTTSKIFKTTEKENMAYIPVQCLGNLLKLLRYEKVYFKVVRKYPLDIPTLKKWQDEFKEMTDIYIPSPSAMYGIVSHFNKEDIMRLAVDASEDDELAAFIIEHDLK